MNYNSTILLVIFITLAICNQPVKVLASTCRIIHELANCSDDSTCPTWFTCTSQKSCRCGNQYKGEILCDSDHHFSSVFDCYCVTYDEETKSTYIGSSIYNCYSNTKYNCLPDNPKKLKNNSVCTQFHRTDLLCGDYEEGYSPFILS